MTQATTWGVPLSSPSPPTTWAARADNSLDAQLSNHSGASRPPYAVANTIWVKEVSSSVVEHYLYDGVSDILIGTFDLDTHKYIPNVATLAQAINEGKTADVPSAATTNIWLATGNLTHITGTATISSFGTAPQAGASRRLIFDSALTLTHSASLKCPGAVDIVLGAGDVLEVLADTTTVMIVTNYSPASSGFYAGTGTRTAASATGTVSYTTPFRPSLIEFSGVVMAPAGYESTTSGFICARSGNQQCVYEGGGSSMALSDTGVMKFLYDHVADVSVTCTITNTGFDLTFTKNNSGIYATAYFNWVAKR